MWRTIHTSCRRGTLFQVDTAGALTPVPGQESYIKARGSKFTFHFAVGQAF